MSWLLDSSLTCFKKICVNILKCGPIPKHIALIMDGNRRYATKAKIEKIKGHSKGSEKLTESLDWCFALGITEITVYAFSIENFKRSEDEVNALMSLATEKFQRWLDEKDKIMADGVCIRVFGKISILSKELQKLIAKVMLLTKDNNRFIWNIALAYTTRDDIYTTAKTLSEDVNKGFIKADDINVDLFSDCMYTRKAPNPDIIVRTSGEVRFSDFLIWQISNSYISFTKVLWPELNNWHLLLCIFMYQRCYQDLKKSQEVESKKNERQQKYLEELEHRMWSQLRSYIE